MRGFLSTVLYIFIGLPVALSALFLVSVRPWALDPATYRRFVADDRLYAALQAPQLAARAPATIELRPAGSGAAVGGGAALVLDGPILVSTLQRDLPWPDIKAAASKAVDSGLEAATGRGAAPELDLRPLKLALEARAPAAARDYLAALAAASRPSPSGLSSALLAKALSAQVEALPDIAVPDPATLDRARRQALPGPLGALPLGRLSRGPEPLTQARLDRMTAASVALSLLLIAGLGALGGRSLGSRLARAGRYLLLPSILILALGAILAIPGGLILQNLFPPQARALLEGSGLLRAYLASALGPIARSFLVAGLVGASLGGVLAASRRYLEPRAAE